MTVTVHITYISYLYENKFNDFAIPWLYILFLYATRILKTSVAIQNGTCFSQVTIFFFFFGCPLVSRTRYWICPYYTRGGMYNEPVRARFRICGLKLHVKKIIFSLCLQQSYIYEQFKISQNMNSKTIVVNSINVK